MENNHLRVDIDVFIECVSIHNIVYFGAILYFFINLFVLWTIFNCFEFLSRWDVVDE